MKVLGIDPGIERLGWGVVEKTSKGARRISSGVKKTLKTSSDGTRLYEIHEFLNELFKKERPDLVSVEKIFFSKNVKTALIIGGVRGIILALSAKHGIRVREFTPLEVKMGLTGYGRAGKENVAHMVRLSLEAAPTKMLDDESDALAIAICGVYSR